MTNKITAVVFDFGNVLAKVDRLKICSRFSKHSSLSPEEICNRIYGTDIEFNSETGKYDSKRHFLVIKECINADDNWSYEEFFKEFKDGFEENPDGEQALLYAGKKARVFVLSNTTKIHSEWLLEHEKLSQIPELFIFSYQVGVMKPDKRIWEILCEKAHVKPQECLYIDDIEIYCQSAQEMGFNVIHYDMNKMKLKDEIKKWL